MRQVASLWMVKEQLWGRCWTGWRAIRHSRSVDSVPTPDCRFGQAHTCRGFREQATFGHDPGSKATIYGFRHHLRITWTGVVAAVGVAPANIHDRDLVPELAGGTIGQVLGIGTTGIRN